MYLLEEASLGEEGVVGAEEDAFGSDESGYGLEDVGAVEVGGSGGVEVDVFHVLGEPPA